MSKSAVALASVPLVGSLVPITKSLSLFSKAFSSIRIVPIPTKLVASFTFTLIAPAVEVAWSFSSTTTFLNVLFLIVILFTSIVFAPLPKLRSIPAALLLIKSASLPDPSPISVVLDPSNNELSTTRLANCSAYTPALV